MTHTTKSIAIKTITGIKLEQSDAQEQGLESSTHTNTTQRRLMGTELGTTLLLFIPFN